MKKAAPTRSRASAVVGLDDAKARLSSLVERARLGGEITITKRGTPVARLVPVRGSATEEKSKNAIQRLLARRKTMTLGGLKVADLIKEGRR